MPSQKVDRRSPKISSNRAVFSLYAYVAPLITAGMGGMQVESIALEGVRRALNDSETVAALRQSLSP
jgi:hypothetical protein